MKANRKFLNGDDEAVSPVIAVILMVAITVVLAATVYVWVSGFGSGGGNTPAHTMSMTSGGALTAEDATAPANDAFKPYTVSSADPSLTYGDMKFTVDGVEFPFIELTDAECAAGEPDDANTFGWGACQGVTALLASDAVEAAQSIWVIEDDDADLENAQLIVLDTQANSVMITLKIR